ncbi:MAG TPA: hypothetical protein PLV92_26195, partial [Pirellulaceae bacterium]|nr:hypothetical protein [Pirellulaceae bacterium]
MRRTPLRNRPFFALIAFALIEIALTTPPTSSLLPSMLPSAFISTAVAADHATVVGVMDANVWDA